MALGHFYHPLLFQIININTPMHFILLAQLLETNYLKLTEMLIHLSQKCQYNTYQKYEFMVLLYLVLCSKVHEK